MIKSEKNRTAFLIIAGVTLGTAAFYLLAVANRLLKHPKAKYESLCLCVHAFLFVA